MSASIPDLAALLMARHQSVMTKIDRYRAAGGSWTENHLLGHALTEHARTNLMSSISSMVQLEQLLDRQISTAGSSAAQTAANAHE